MKNKLLILIVILILGLIGTVGTTYAATTTCQRCGGSATISYGFISSSMHSRWYNCSKCGASTSMSSEGHTERTKSCSFSEGCYKVYCAYDCGYGYTKAHTLTSCTTCGAAGVHCSSCGATDPSHTCAPAHTHTPGSAATCESPQTCTDCGEVITEALGHDHSEPCTTCWKSNMVCSRCGDTLPHNCHEHDFTYSPADCTSPASCSCGATSGWPLGHNWVETGRIEATCMENGIIYEECSRCHITSTSRIPKGPHSYGNSYTASGAAGCYNVCTICNTSNSVTPHQSNGVSAGYDDNQHYEVCERCGYKINYENHNLITTVTKQPTCTLSGTNRTSCSECDYGYSGTVPATGHTFGGYVPNGASGHRKKCISCDTYDNTVPHTMSTSLVLSLDDETKHCYRCSVCLYESNIASHTYVVKSYQYNPSTRKYTHTRWCNVCELYELSPEECSFTDKVTLQTSCTAPGNRRYTCSVCQQYYDKEIPQISHVWSDWQTSVSEHWYKCTYDCGTEKSRGTHVDTSPKDGYCDTCGYLLYIIPELSISSDVTVKENDTVTFSVNLLKGTAPITYQWYYKTSQSGTPNAISGANGTTLSFTATKEMNGRYYYCTATNLGGPGESSDAKLTVYYEFTIGNQPQDINLKKGETGTFSVSIGESGNPDSYTYQWYIANSSDGNGSRLPGATANSYSVTPNKNISAEYYYCVISNGQYTKTSTRAKLTADVEIPVINLGTGKINKYINSEAEIVIPLVVTDIGEGYTENGENFTEDDIIVKVEGVANNSASKELKHISSNGNNHLYELTLTGITENGDLWIEIPAGSIQDNFKNKNENKRISEFTVIDENGITKENEEIIVDNTPPKISFKEAEIYESDEKYANSGDTIIVTVSIFEEVGMDINEFDENDIKVMVGANDVSEHVEKDVEFSKKDGKNYEYTITLSNVIGEGELAINIPDEKVNDYAKNKNENTTLDIKKDGENIIIDNTAPNDVKLNTKLGGYNSEDDYPTSLDPRHKNWSNENIYVSIEAKDNNATGDEGLYYYYKAEKSTSDFIEIDSKHIIDSPVDDIICFRVMDRAGNCTDVKKEIKFDNVNPNKPVISLFEQRLNGADYVYDATKPIDKSVYVIPQASSLVDVGSVKSGIETNMEYTYYTITTYTNPSKTQQIGETKPYEYDEYEILTKSGYYEIAMTLTDIAGNTTIGDVYKVYIAKKAENTIKITNINDIGSGIKKATIKIYKGDEGDNKTTEEAIDPIVINDPYKEIIKNVRLGDGTFYVEVTLEDKVGNSIVLEKTIKNKL